MTSRNLRIGLDIDDTLADFINSYKEYFNTSRYPSRLKENNITKNVVRVLKFDRNFWVNLPIKNTISFIPELYCTARVCNKNWTKRWLVTHGFPKRPVYQIFGHGVNKAKLIKGKVDLFIDDSIINFELLNASGIPCLLLDQYNTKSWGLNGKIHSLDLDEILEEYSLFKHKVFPYFVELI